MKNFNNILVICNPKTKDSELIEKAIRLLKHGKGILTVVDVLKNLPVDSLTDFETKKVQALQKAVMDERKKQLDSIVSHFKGGQRKIETNVLSGKFVIEIIKEVREKQSDLVMLTADGAGPIRDQIFGSNSMHLIRKCPCPVWVVKPIKRVKYREILAAIDLSSDGETGRLNDMIMDFSIFIAHLDHAKLHIVHACDFYAESLLKESPYIHYADVESMANHVWDDHKAKFDQLISKLDFQGVKYELHFDKGDACDIITEMANREEVDLVVMGTVNRTNYKGFLIGSTAERVCYQVNSSILALKPEGFISPIMTA